MRVLVAVFLAVLASGCASVSGQGNPRDPWEEYNRSAYAFNDAFDRAAFKPVVEVYVNGTLDFLREGVANFFENIYDINTGINNILQGKVADGVGDLARFAVNSVMGIGGLWDVATPMGLEKHHEDFGQTLGRWGVPPGPYFVIPFLGPSTLRDAPARFVDPNYAYNRQISDIALRNSLFGLDTVRTRADLLKAGKIRDEAALDPYSFTRDAWLQRRRNQVYDGRPPRDPEDDE